MNDRRRLILLNGRLISTPLTDFWQISQTVQDPSIPNLPLTTPAGGAAAQTLTQGTIFENENTFFAHTVTTVEVAVPEPRRYSGVGYLVDDGKKRETITLYDEEAEILELLAAIMPVIQAQQQRRAI